MGLLDWTLKALMEKGKALWLQYRMDENQLDEFARKHDLTGALAFELIKESKRRRRHQAFLR